MTDDRLTPTESLARFIRDACDLGPAYSQDTESLYSAYWAWCELNEQARMKRKKFPAALVELRLRPSKNEPRVTAGVRARV